MDKISWRQFGYLEGLRVIRNDMRNQNRKARLKYESAKEDYESHGMQDDYEELYEYKYTRAKGIFEFAALQKIRCEKFYKSECERLFKMNPDLKKFMENRDEHGQFNFNDVKTFIQENVCLI